MQERGLVTAIPVPGSRCQFYSYQTVMLWRETQSRGQERARVLLLWEGGSSWSKETSLGGEGNAYLPPARKGIRALPGSKELFSIPEGSRRETA